MRLSSRGGEEGGGDSVSLVEVWSGGKWRGVCDEGRWGQEEAATVCRQLGYHGSTVTAGRACMENTLCNIPIQNLKVYKQSKF